MLVGIEAQMGEDARDVIVHARGHPPVLLREVGVVRKVVADLVLSLVQSINLGRVVYDPLHDRVLKTIACRSRWSHLRPIGTLYTCGVVESLCRAVPCAASSGGRATMSIILIGVIEAHVCCRWSSLLGSICLGLRLRWSCLFLLGAVSCPASCYRTGNTVASLLLVLHLQS
jgi:hypothetical protein